MMKECFVGFDTSNYTTSASVCTAEGEIIANIKAPLPVKEGECGLRQSDAVFAHVKNLPEVTRTLREAIRGYRVLAVGCSTRPRDLEDSYMPCFLSGRAAAETFAAALDRDAWQLGSFAPVCGDCVVIGNEGHGLRASTIAACDRTVFIPMTDRAESLNAAVAASLLMWAFRTENNTTTGRDDV